MRFLYASAFIYGLSAGNHATVAFYLPAIVLLFFYWERRARFKNLFVSSLIFLIGLSVYLYLPIRSLAEPTIDWGNPETIQEFLYQVTDREHAETHFDRLPAGKSVEPDMMWTGLSSFGANALHVFMELILDLNKQLTPITVVGFFVGALLCFKTNLPLFFVFFLFNYCDNECLLFRGMAGRKLFSHLHRGLFVDIRFSFLASTGNVLQDQ